MVISSRASRKREGCGPSWGSLKGVVAEMGSKAGKIALGQVVMGSEGDVERLTVDGASHALG